MRRTLSGQGIRKYEFVLFAVLLFAWLSFLSSSDSYISPYILYALSGFIAFMECRGWKEKETREEKTGGILFSLVFSLATTLANYKLIKPLGGHLISAAILFTGSYLLARIILRWLLYFSFDTVPHRAGHPHTPAYLFCSAFFIISGVDLFILLFCYQPGILTYDSMYQIRQILTDSITNHHPFWHTILLKMFLSFGMKLFHNINVGVLAYNVFQILCMAGIFSYLIMTLYQVGVPRFFVFLTFLAYVVLPYHILYSMTVWKDILFAGAVTLFSCSLYRIFQGVGRRKLNFLFLIVGSLGTCLFRSNGFSAFAVTFLVIAIVLRKSERALILALLGSLLLAFFLKYPMLQILNIKQTPTVEYLSIPAQQMARLLVEDVDLDEKDLQDMELVMDTQAAKERYQPILSDPVKGTVKAGYVSEHKWESLSLWLRLGLEYPIPYLEAWIDQTRGYWNGGYAYWVFTTEMRENDYGIMRNDPESPGSQVFGEWLKQFSDLPFFQIFQSIGLHDWILALCAIILCLRKRKDVLLCVLPVMIILTLLISTPVFSEFRYAYAVFTTLPLILSITFTAPHGLNRSRSTGLQPSGGSIADLSARSSARSAARGMP